MAQPTDYELQRAKRIQENKRKMEEMGLLAASRGLAGAAAAGTASVALAAGSEPAPRCKRRRAEPAQPTAMEPTRLSRRLRGVTALTLDEAAAAALAEAEAEGRARARAAGARKQLRLEEGRQLAAPFSLWSIGVTVWELGRVHRGAWAHRYWSSSGCLYHHAYPVGYRASKVQFGRTYEMRIEEGPSGPLFKVVDMQTGAVFSGASPTKPWTDVCIAHRTGQRISGPLFFGFSDPLTQRAIAVNLYSQEELQAALQGERIEGSSASPEEQAAREFSAVEGIGEATAIVLARTAALGGARHGSLGSLRSWAGASEENACALLSFLTGSEEVPESTRRWPAWQQRLAPRIVLAVSGRWLGAGPAPQLAAAAGAAAEGPDEACPGLAAELHGQEEGGFAAEAAAGAAAAAPADDAARPGGAAAADGQGNACGSKMPLGQLASDVPDRALQNGERQLDGDVKLQRSTAAAAAAPEQQQHQQQQQRALAKENLAAHNGAAAMPRGPASKPRTAQRGPAAAPRSGRERRANSRFAEYLTGEAEACMEFALD